MACFRLDKKGKKVLIFDTAGEISKFALKEWGEAAGKAEKQGKKFSVALSGGKTPLPFYSSLAAQGREFSWGKTDLFFVDERFVPHHDPASNFGAIKNVLFRKINIPADNIHPVYFENTAEEAASKYEGSIRDFFRLAEGQIPRFDLIILGLGKEGHTASLFPGVAALAEKRRLVSAVAASGIKGERISLTLPVINRAKKIIFLISGSNKACAAGEVIEKGNDKLPASLVKPDNGELCYLIDKAAAAEINYKQ